MSRCLATLLAIFVAIGLSAPVVITPATASSPSTSAVAHDARIQVMGPDDPVGPMLSVVCPDGVVNEEGRAGCRSCPEDAPESSGTLRMRRIYRGYFSGSSTKEAVVALAGCSTGPDQRHATAFLRQREPDTESWELVHYAHGQRTTPCRILPVGGTPVLICRDIDRYGTDIRALAHNGTQWNATTLARIDDKAGDCRFDGPRVARKERVVTGPLVDDEIDLAILVKVQRGNPRHDDVDECNEEYFDIERSWRLDVFRLTDDGFRHIEIDDPCGHPLRAKILTGATPDACR